MVDVARAHRRWLARRLGFLLPLLAVALGAAAWIAVEPGPGGWLKAGSLVLAFVCVAALGFLVALTLACAACHARGEHRAARALRDRLDDQARLAAVCFLSLTALVATPALLRLPDLAPASPLRAHPLVASRSPPADAPVFPAFSPLPPAPTPPQVLPVRAEPPAALDLAELDLAPPAPPAPPIDPSPTPDTEQPRFRPEALTLDLLRLVPEAFERPGLPGEDEAVAPPPSARIELMLLTLEGHGRGSAGRVDLDFPLDSAGSLRAEFFGAVFGSGNSVEELDAEWGWTRLSVGYVRRLLGHSSHAPLDLSVSAGLALDDFLVENEAEGIDERGRLSPWVAVDVGYWQDGRVGLLAHAEQGLAVNLTGSTSAVTILAALLRVELSERISLYGGYRLLIVELREYQKPLRHEGGRASLDEELAGPLLGVELRF